MSKEETYNANTRFYSIIDGTFRTSVEETHPDAIRRDWETPDGKSGTKYERIVHALFGIITAIEFKDGDYGTNLNITLDPDEDGISPVMSLNTSSQYGENVLKMLPNMQPNTEYRFRPYSFLGENEKEVRGMEITTKDEDGKFTKKVPNFFYDPETKQVLNGYPIPEGDTKNYKSDDWKLFYLQAKKFLIKYTEENVLARYSQANNTNSTYEYPQEELKPEDIPF